MKKRLSTSLFTLLLGIAVSGMYVLPNGEDEVTLYPNPAKTDVNITIDLDYSLSTELRIIDLTGKVVKDFSNELSYEDGKYKGRLDIGDLKTGIYFVRVVQQKSTFSKKLIIK